MKSNKILLFFIFATSSYFAQAQLIDNVFINKIPNNILPTLSKDIRTDVLKNYYAGQQDTTRNIFQNDVFVLDYDSVSNYISIQTAENAHFEMKLFPTKQKMDSTSYVIGIITTVCAPACSSYIRFYDSNWNRINLDIPTWKAADWLADKDQVFDGVKLADIFKSSFIELHFDKEKNLLTVKNNSADLLSVEDKLFVKPYLNNEVKTETIKISGDNVTVSR